MTGMGDGNERDTRSAARGDAIREIIEWCRVNARAHNDTAAMLELRQAQHAEDELNELLANQRTGRIVHGDA